MSKLYFPSYEALRQWIFTRNNVNVYTTYTSYREFVSDLGQDDRYTFLILVWLSENCPDVE